MRAASAGLSNAVLWGSGDSTRLSYYVFESYGLNSQINVTDDYSLKPYIMNFLQLSDAYYFYFSGHGGTDAYGNDVIAGHNSIWSLQKSTIASYGGNWTFVFLDACFTGKASWAAAFGISYSTPGRAYLGWSDSVSTGTASKFCEKFWYLANTNRVRTSALAAKNDLPNDYVPIFFQGDLTYKLP